MVPRGSLCFWLLYVNMLYGNLAGSNFQILSPFGKIKHFWNKKSIFELFHAVPGVFGSIMLTCYKELRWFPYHIMSLFGKIRFFFFFFFLNKSAFSRWFHVVSSVFSSIMIKCCKELRNLDGSHFRFLACLVKQIIFGTKVHFLDGSIRFSVFLFFCFFFVFWYLYVNIY